MGDQRWIGGTLKNSTWQKVATQLGRLRLDDWPQILRGEHARVLLLCFILE